MVTEKTRMSKMAIDAEIWVTGAAGTTYTTSRLKSDSSISKQKCISHLSITIIYYS